MMTSHTSQSTCLLRARLQVPHSEEIVRVDQLKQMGYPDTVYLVLSHTLDGVSRDLRVRLNHNRAFLSRQMQSRLPGDSGNHSRPLLAGHSSTFCYYSATSAEESARDTLTGAINLCGGYISGVLTNDGTQFVLESAIDEQNPATNHSSSSVGDSVFVIPPEQVNSLAPVCDRRWLRLVVGSDGVVRRNRAKRSTNVQVPDYYSKYLDGKIRYLEMVLVSDSELYTRYLGEVDQVRDRLISVANIVNQLYAPLNLHVILTDIDIWTGSDPVLITSDHEQTLNNFLYYRKMRLLKDRPNDNAQLLTGKRFGDGVVGKANKGTMCSYEYSGGVNSDSSRRLAAVASTVAHEMGHNFGMEHDTDACKCANERCIMAASSGGIGPTAWSDCSLENYAYGLKHGTDFCLRNKPELAYDSPTCGNGLVEPGEECDCGDAKVCTNRCCVASTCKLAAGAACASGECCDTGSCSLKEATTVCRSPTNPCDLPEFCDGRGEVCPRDTHIQNGLPCNGGKALCYEGRCGDRNDRCSLLWGSSGKTSDPKCDELLNGKSTANGVGNCGFDRDSGVYKACDKSQTRCGRLHCEHNQEKPEFGEMSMAHIGHTKGWMYKGQLLKCYAVRIDFANVDVLDPGMTPDGAICDTDKMCVDTQCVPVQRVRKQVSSSWCKNDCHSLGVCNQFGNCHCQVGYGGNDCSLPGPGGSLDSGPAGEPGGLSAVWMLLMFVVVCAVIAGGIYALVYRKKRNVWPHQKLLRQFAAASMRRPGSSSAAPAGGAPVGSGGAVLEPRRKAPPPPSSRVGPLGPASAIPSAPPSQPSLLLATNKVWQQQQQRNQTTPRAVVNPWTTVAHDANTDAVTMQTPNGFQMNGYSNPSDSSVMLSPAVGFRNGTKTRPDISAPIPQGQTPAALHLRFKDTEEQAGSATNNNGTVKLRARTLDAEVEDSTPPQKKSLPELRAEPSHTRQPAETDVAPPVPQRPRDSELQQLYATTPELAAASNPAPDNWQKTTKEGVDRTERQQTRMVTPPSTILEAAAQRKDSQGRVRANKTLPLLPPIGDKPATLKAAAGRDRTPPTTHKATADEEVYDAVPLSPDTALPTTKRALLPPVQAVKPQASAQSGGAKPQGNAPSGGAKPALLPKPPKEDTPPPTKRAGAETAPNKVAEMAARFDPQSGRTRTEMLT